MNKLSSKEYLKLLNSFNQTEITYSQAESILDNAQNNHINYYIDKDNNLFLEKNKKTEKIPCSTILENYIQNKIKENKNDYGIKKYLNESHISHLKQINTSLKISENEFFYNIRKDNDLLKEKLENKQDNNKREIWNNLTLKQKAAAIATVLSKEEINNPQLLINTFNYNPSVLKKYLSGNEIKEVQKISNAENPIKILNNIIEKAYKEDLEPSGYKIIKHYPDDKKEINYTDNKEDGKNFLLELRKLDPQLISSELYDSKNKHLLFEITKDRIIDYENHNTDKNNNSHKKFFELSEKIKKLQNQKKQLSNNNNKEVNKNNYSSNLNNKQESKLEQIEKKLTCGLSEKQINAILSKTEKMADKFININNNKRSRKL